MLRQNGVMAKHQKTRSRLFVPRIKESLAAGALAASDAISTAFTATVDRPYWLASIDTMVGAQGFAGGDGPVIVGIAHSDYSAAEIEEWIEATASWSSIDKVEQEQARRKCRIIGQVNDPASQQFNDGKITRTKCGWILEAGSTLSLFIYNDGVAVLTAGGVVDLTGRAYLSPR